MATTYKLLGQQNPGASWTALYTVPSSTSAVLSTVVICNTSASARTFRVAVVSSSATTPTAANALAYDTALPPNETIVMTMGVTLGASYCLKVYGSTTDVTFTAFGSEIT